MALEGISWYPHHSQSGILAFPDSYLQLKGTAMRRITSTVALLAIVFCCNLCCGQPKDWPEEHRQLANQTIGDWELTGFMGKQKIQGTASTRWAEKQACIIETVTMTGLTATGQEWTASDTSVTGWDSARKRVVMCRFGSDGMKSSYSKTHFTSKSPTVLTGERTTVSGGKDFKQLIEAHFNSPDETLIIARSADGKQLQGKVTYKRVK